MADILFSQFNGISDSIWMGIAGAFSKMVGIDIHSQRGSITVNQALAKQSGTTITALCRHSLTVSNGDKYFFSYTDGKIWRLSSGTYTLAYTTSPAAGAAGCLGAYEFNSFVFWATQSRLHRIAVSGLADWTANAVPNWQTFTKTDTEFHPMTVQNGALYIGDASYISSVNSSSTFTAAALDLIPPLRVRTIAPFDIDLVIGTVISTSINICNIIRWDTVQTSWQFSEPVYENGVNAFLWLGTSLAAQCGTYGNFYLYDGQYLQPYKRIPGTWSPTKYGEVYPQAVGNLLGKPIFGFTNGSGNPADSGVYSLGNYSKDYPRVMNGLEFPISTGNVSGIQVGSILVDGSDLYVAWGDTNSSTYGVDKLDYAAKYASAYLETLVLIPDSEEISVLSKVFANWQSMPSGCSLTFKFKANHASSYTAATSDFVHVDTTIQQTYCDQSVEGRVVQIRIEFVVSGNNAPVVEQIGVAIANLTAEDRAANANAS